MRAILMNKYTPLLEVDLENDTVIKVDKVLNRDMMPVLFRWQEVTAENVTAWLKKRRIPENREGLKEARMNFRGFEEDEHMLSLSDQYWFKTKRADSWDKLNYFTNFYSQEPGKIFFMPWEISGDDYKAPSPDRTTNGNLKKRWIQEEDKTSYLIKAGSIIYHQEPLSEVMASLMLEKLNLLPYVKYSLVVDGLRFCSRCRNFINENTEFVPAAHIYRKGRPENVSVYDYLIYLCGENGITGAKDYLDKLILIDHILCNTDRHLNNFGFIRSAQTGEFLGFAPVFDSGSAYWGTKAVVEKAVNKLFADQEDTVLKKAFENGTVHDYRVTKEMMDLLAEYPAITTEKRKSIRKMIEEREAKLERVEGETRGGGDGKKELQEVEFEL